jgi:hypothetical protein
MLNLEYRLAGLTLNPRHWKAYPPSGAAAGVARAVSHETFRLCESRQNLLAGRRLEARTKLFRGIVANWDARAMTQDVVLRGAQDTELESITGSRGEGASPLGATQILCCEHDLVRKPVSTFGIMLQGNIRNAAALATSP